LTPQEALLITQTEPFIFLDVRTNEEFAESHLPNAILIPYTEIAERAESELPDRNAVILVYCRAGRRSEIAARELLSLGYTNVYDIGGLQDVAGYLGVSQPEIPLSAEVQGRIRQDFSRADVQELFDRFDTTEADVDYVRIDRYLGTFNDNMVLAIRPAGTVFADERWCESVAGRVFMYDTTQPLLVWDSESGQFFRMGCALDASLLTTQDVEDLHFNLFNIGYVNPVLNRERERTRFGNLNNARCMNCGPLCRVNSTAFPTCRNLLMHSIVTQTPLRPVAPLPVTTRQRIVDAAVGVGNNIFAINYYGIYNGLVAFRVEGDRLSLQPLLWSVRNERLQDRRDFINYYQNLMSAHDARYLRIVEQAHYFTFFPGLEPPERRLTPLASSMRTRIESDFRATMPDLSDEAADRIRVIGYLGTYGDNVVVVMDGYEDNNGIYCEEGCSPPVSVRVWNNGQFQSYPESQAESLGLTQEDRRDISFYHRILMHHGFNFQDCRCWDEWWCCCYELEDRWENWCEDCENSIDYCTC
jgi:rhodanese-related sulfurtransferase